MVTRYDALRSKQTQPAALVVGGLPEGRQLDAIRRGARLGVATPGRGERAHGDRSQSQRTAALAGFQRGQHRVLVATYVAARGILVPDIAHVINYDLPDVAENFIHRVGRTGRAGERGVASTLFVREQRTELFQLEQALGIRMERASLNGKSFEKRAPPSTRHRADPSDIPPQDGSIATGIPASPNGKLIPGRNIDPRLCRCSYTDTHKCAIMKMQRLLFFRNALDRVPKVKLVTLISEMADPCE